MLDSIQSETHKESLAIKGIEKRLMKEDRITTYIACEELNFTWSNEQVSEFEKRWRTGKKFGQSSLDMIAELSKRFNRLPEEIVILALDRGMNSKI